MGGFLHCWRLNPGPQPLYQWAIPTAPAFSAFSLWSCVTKDVFRLLTVVPSEYGAKWHHNMQVSIVTFETLSSTHLSKASHISVCLWFSRYYGGLFDTASSKKVAWTALRRVEFLPSILLSLSPSSSLPPPSCPLLPSHHAPSLPPQDITACKFIPVLWERKESLNQQLPPSPVLNLFWAGPIQVNQTVLALQAEPAWRDLPQQTQVTLWGLRGRRASLQRSDKEYQGCHILARHLRRVACSIHLVEFCYHCYGSDTGCLVNWAGIQFMWLSLTQTPDLLASTSQVL